MGGFFDTAKDNVNPAHNATEKHHRLGSDTAHSASNQNREQQKLSQPPAALNRSSTLNKSNAEVDEMAMSMEDTDFAISESNFSQSMISNKFGASQTKHNSTLKSNLAANRDRAST